MKNKSKIRQQKQGVDVMRLVLLLHIWEYRVQITALLSFLRFSALPSDIPNST
jgi:hypothetical protein